jgi:N-acetylmuramoyl-L-alanine amidase
MRVLAGANMPAVLVELGYLSTPDEEQTLASNDFQNQITQALVEALIDFRGFVEQGSATQPTDSAMRPVADGAGEQ